MPPRRQQQAPTPVIKDLQLDKEPVTLHADARAIAVDEEPQHVSVVAEAQRLAAEAVAEARALEQSALDRALKLANERMRTRERQEIAAAAAAGSLMVHEVAAVPVTPASEPPVSAQLDGARLRRSRIPMTHQLNRRHLN